MKADLKIKFLIPVIIGMIFLCLTAIGQDKVYDPYFNPYPNEFEVLIREIPVFETIRDTVYVNLSNMDSITRRFGITFDEYVRQFMTFKHDRDSTDAMSDELIYMNYFLPLLEPGKTFLERRIVTREYTIKRMMDSISLGVTCLRNAEMLESKNLQADFMLTCYGSDNTANFLHSPSQIKSCLGQLFTEIAESNGKIKGLNIYFPDYDFKEKKAMAQFVKSVSILIDSLPQKNIRDLRYYISFDERNRVANRAYLSCLAQMADSVFLLSRTGVDNTIPLMSVIDYNSAMDQTFWSKLTNQFYLAKFYVKPFPVYNYKETFTTNIERFIDADYPYNHWESYLFVLVGIAVLIIVVLLLYRINPTFSFYMNKNIDYAYSLIIIMILEVLLLTVCMFEAMSEENIFTLGTENRYFVLLLPLLFIFIVPMMKAVGKRRQLP